MAPRLTLPPDADSWAAAFRLEIERELGLLEWARARAFADKDELPDATRLPNKLARVVDENVLAFSDGTVWRRADTGASSADATEWPKSPADKIAEAVAGLYLSGSATYDPASLNDGDGATTTVTVTGAALGDFAVASFSLDLQGVTLSAYVSAANTVSVRFQNETGGVLDLGSGTLRARVIEA